MRELTEQEIVRREKLNNIKQPYPEKYEINYDICDACVLEDGVTGVKVAGRIVLMRKMGKMSSIRCQVILFCFQASLPALRSSFTWSARWATI